MTTITQEICLCGSSNNDALWQTKWNLGARFHRVMAAGGKKMALLAELARAFADILGKEPVGEMYLRRLVLKSGADLDAVNYLQGVTPLVHATLKHDMRRVKRFVDEVKRFPVFRPLSSRLLNSEFHKPPALPRLENCPPSLPE